MPDSAPTLRDFYAAERTLLAWIRTTLAMMGFGFVLARFGVFLREIRALEQPGAFRSAGLSVWFGILLIAFGIAINIIAVVEYRRDMARLNVASTEMRPPSMLATWTSFGLAVLGVLMSAYLVAIS